MTQAGGGPAVNPVSPEWWQQKTFWVSLTGVVTGAGAILALVLHDQKWALGAASLAGILGNLGSVFARQGGTQAALEVGDRAGVLSPAEKEKKTP